MFYQKCSNVCVNYVTLYKLSHPWEKRHGWRGGDAFYASVAVKSALRLPPSFWHCLIVSCHLIPLPYSCPIQPMQSWGDKKDSANTLVLPHTRGTISESHLRLSFTEMLCEEHVKLKNFLGCCLPFLWLHGQNLLTQKITL